MVVAGLLEARVAGAVDATTLDSLRRLSATSDFEAGRLVGRVVAARSDAMTIELTCAESRSRTFLSRSSIGFLLMVSRTVAATLAITGVADVVTSRFFFSTSS